MNVQSEQLTLDGKLELSLDQRLNRNETKCILENLFGDKLSEERFGNKKLFVVNCNNKKIILLTAQISYLGNPHPIYKKRVQLKNWFSDVIAAYSNSIEYDIRLIGIYRYKGNVIFADFDKETYRYKKMHNSSAHIYVNDLYKAWQTGFFHKVDFFNNSINVISSSNFVNYLSDSNELLNNNEEHRILQLVEKFNEDFFKKSEWIEVDKAVDEMKRSQFPKWKECEWAGFYLEYKFDYFTVKNKIQEHIAYLNNDAKDLDLDFDIKFNEANFYGDLKASSIEKLDTMLNDAMNVEREIEKYGKLWYLIYEHETIKDRDLENFPYTKARLETIRKYEPDYKAGNDLSYSSRLKAKVRYDKMMIVEINKFNLHTLLEKMTSNFHQPNHGKTRNPKFKLTKQNIKNAIIYCYSPKSKDN